MFIVHYISSCNRLFYHASRSAGVMNSGYKKCILSGLNESRQDASAMFARSSADSVSTTGSLQRQFFVFSGNAAAFFVFFPASTGTWIVASDLGTRPHRSVNLTLPAHAVIAAVAKFAFSHGFQFLVGGRSALWLEQRLLKGRLAGFHMTHLMFWLG